MAVSARVESIDRDVALLISETLSPAAQSKILAQAARDQLATAEQTNQRVLGRIPPHKTYVDGQAGTNEDRVRPDGTIVYEFELQAEMLAWIGDQLQQHSPVGGGRDPHPGLYRASHTLFVDGKEVPLGSSIPMSREGEIVFISTTPYSRKLEQGSSHQAPDGIYQAVTALARRRFGNLARIEFTYRGLIGRSSGAGTLINPANAPSKARVRGRGGRFASTGGSQAHNQSDKRFPCIVVHLK